MVTIIALVIALAVAVGAFILIRKKDKGQM